MFASDTTDSELTEGDTVVLNCTVRSHGNEKPNVTVDITDDQGHNLTSEVHSLLNSTVQHRVIVTSSLSRSFHCKITATIVNIEIVSKTYNVTLNHARGEFFEHRFIMSLMSSIKSRPMVIVCIKLEAESYSLFQAKFHYAILVADRSEAGRRPVADLLALC